MLLFGTFKAFSARVYTLQGRNEGHFAQRSEKTFTGDVNAARCVWLSHYFINVFVSSQEEDLNACLLISILVNSYLCIF